MWGSGVRSDNHFKNPPGDALNRCTDIVAYQFIMLKYPISEKASHKLSWGPLSLIETKF